MSRGDAGDGRHGAAFAGTPSPLTEREREKVLVAYMCGANDALAAQAIGKSERWLRYRKEAYPELREEIGQMMTVADGLVRQSLFRNATKSNNVAAQIFWMKNRFGWADRTHVSATLDVNILPAIVERSFDPKIIEAARSGMPPELEASQARELPARPGDEKRPPPIGKTRA